MNALTSVSTFSPGTHGGDGAGTVLPPLPTASAGRRVLDGAFAVLDALALVLIGPGAYSIDARRFGRRLVVLPPD